MSLAASCSFAFVLLLTLFFPSCRGSSVSLSELVEASVSASESDPVTVSTLSALRRSSSPSLSCSAIASFLPATQICALNLLASAQFRVHTLPRLFFTKADAFSCVACRKGSSCRQLPLQSHRLHNLQLPLQLLHCLCMHHLKQRQEAISGLIMLDLEDVTIAVLLHASLEGPASPLAGILVLQGQPFLGTVVLSLFGLQPDEVPVP